MKNCCLLAGNPVQGEGPVPASIMFIGEAPGREEDESGRPFVGDAGKRLSWLLDQAGIKRESVYITNLVKCRPPKNRKPLKSEIKACSPNLAKELSRVLPNTIITLGATAAHEFDKEVKLERDHGRGRSITYNGKVYRLIPMYHPAAAMYDAKLWPVLLADFMRLKEELEEPKPAITNYVQATDEEAFLYAANQLIIGFDLETTSPEIKGRFAVQEAEIVGYSVSVAPGTGVYVQGKPILMKHILESPYISKICHNAKFEYGVLKRSGIKLANFHCTKIAAWLLQHHSTHLKALTRQILNRDPITYEQVAQGRDMSEVPVEEIVPYAAADADNTLSIWPVLEHELRKRKLWDIYQSVELPLIPILHSMEYGGVGVDEARTSSLLDRLQEETLKAQEAVYEAGLPRECNLSSAKQLSAALSALGAPITEVTAVSGQLKVNEEALVSVRWWNEGLIDAVLQYRGYKRLHTFAESFLDLRGKDGCLHPDFVQAGSGEEKSDTTSSAPVTGRLSCRGPNLQQIPNKGSDLMLRWGKELRRCIVPRSDMVFVAGDVEQEEPRITALVAPEPKMKEDFEAGILPYKRIGEAIYGYPVDKHKTPREWHVSKTFFLSLVYGAGWTKLKEIEPKLSREAAKAGAERAEETYPGLKRYFGRVRSELKLNGFVRDWFGRVRWIPKVYSTRGQEREEAYREAANFLIQAPAASVMKMAMKKLYQTLPVPARIVLTVHDELVVECLPGQVDEVASLIRNAFNGILPIPLPVELKTGPNWADMEQINDK